MPSIRIETGPGKWTVSLEQGISTNDNEMCVSAIVFQGCLGNRCSLKPRGRLEAANGVVRSYSLSDRRGTWRPRLLPHMETTNAPFLFLRMYGLGMALEYLSHPSLSSLSMSSCCGKAWCWHGCGWGTQLKTGIQLWSCLGHSYIGLMKRVSSFLFYGIMKAWVLGSL